MLTAEGCNWMLRLGSVHLLLPKLSSSLHGLQPLLELPNLAVVDLGPCPVLSDGLLQPLSAAGGLQELRFRVSGACCIGFS